MEMLRREAAMDSEENTAGPRARFNALLAQPAVPGQRPNRPDPETWGADDPDWSTVTLQ